MAVPKMDRVYWWSGGTEYGEWRELTATDKQEAWEIAERIMVGGRVAVAGFSGIGAPEGPPREHLWKRLGAVLATRTV